MTRMQQTLRLLFAFTLILGLAQIAPADDPKATDVTVVPKEAKDDPETQGKAKAKGEEKAKGEAKAKGKQSQKQKKQPIGDHYIRIMDKDGEPVSLQTSILRFVPKPGSKWAKEGITVDLIGAVHIGEKSYYESLNRQFRGYDAMLYELVAPEGTVVPRGGGERGANPISALQGGMKSLLDLEFQLEQVDYTKRNFVHADMSPKEMADSMKERGESVLKMIFKMMGQGFAQQSKQQVSDVEVLMSLFAKDRSRRLKRLMAKQILDMETLNAALSGPDGSNTLIGERNRKALEVMTREINEKRRKRIAIFYGAGHLPDFERRLTANHGMQRLDQVKWLTAWDLSR